MSSELKDFFNACKDHDWYYAQSDDIQVFRDGDRVRKSLFQEAQTNEQKAKIYQAWHDAHFTGPDWKIGTKKAPTPRPEDFGLEPDSPFPEIKRRSLRSKFVEDVR